MPVDQVTAEARASTYAYSTVASKFVTNYRVDKSKEGSPRSCSIIAAILEPTSSKDDNLQLQICMHVAFLNLHVYVRKVFESGVC